MQILDLLQVFLIAMTPIGELRLSIPIGITVYHLGVVLVFFISILGNLVPALFLLFFLKRISDFLSKKTVFFQKIYTWFETRAIKNHSKKIEKYGFIGLIIFTAIPLPLTGAWSGALLATAMDLPLKKSIPALIAGVTGAGIIVSILVILGVNIEKYLGWPALIVILGLTVLTFTINKIKQNNGKQ